MVLTSDAIYLEKRTPANPEFPGFVATGVRVYRGSLLVRCKDGTFVLPQTKSPAAPAVAVVGIADRGVDNTGAGGLATAVGGSPASWPRKGCFAIPFDTAPDWSSYGKPVYAVDDGTVSLTQTPSGGTARLQVGTFAGIDEAGNAFTLIS